MLVFSQLLICVAPAFAQEGTASDTTHLQLKQVEISSQTISNIRQAAVPTQVIGKTEINRLGIQSMADAVRRFAGVIVKDYGGIGGLKTVSIRGFGAQHTAVSVDGVTVSNAQSGQIDIGQFSLENVSQISLEIGQSDNIFQPARNFSSAGILNVVTQAPYFGEKSYVGNVRIKAGSFGQFSPSLYLGKRLKRDLSLALNGDWQRADGNYPFKFNNGSEIEHRKRYNSDVHVYRLGANLYKEWNGRGELTFKNNYFDSDRGLPGTTISDNLYANERLITRTFFSEANGKYHFTDKLSVRASAKLSHTYESYSNSDAVKTTMDRYRQYEYYATSTLLYQPCSRWQVSVAQDYVHNYLFSLYGESSLDPTTYPDRVKSYRDASITAVNARYRSKGLTILGGLVEAYYFEEAKTPDKKKLSPSVSLSYELSSNWLVRLSYKDIYRVPSLNDMYYTQIGNTSLKPELSKQMNVGTTFKNSWGNSCIAFSADAYYNEVKDKIVAVMKMFNSKMMNLNNVRIIGADFKLDYDRTLSEHSRLYFNGTYSYQSAKDKDTKQQIIYTPEHSGNASVSFENPWVNISYSVVACSSEWTQLYYSSLNKVKAYADQSISLNRVWRVKKQSLRLQLDLLNLSNKNYEIIKNYPMPGRSFLLSTTWKF